MTNVFDLNEVAVNTFKEELEQQSINDKVLVPLKRQRCSTFLRDK